MVHWESIYELASVGVGVGVGAVKRFFNVDVCGI